jgi:hypothetical protein
MMTLASNSTLILRSGRRPRLEGWTKQISFETGAVRPPQDEAGYVLSVVEAGTEHEPTRRSASLMPWFETRLSGAPHHEVECGAKDLE